MARWEYDPDWSESYARQQERAWEHGFDSYGERYEARSDVREWMANNDIDYSPELSGFVDAMAEFDRDFVPQDEGGDWTRDELRDYFDALMDEYGLDYDDDMFYDWVQDLYGE